MSPGPGGADPDLSANEVGAKKLLEGVLGTYDLAELADWAWTLFKQGQDIDMIMAQLPEQPAFQNRYPAYAQLAAEGRAISIPAYREYESSVRDALHRYGMPQGMYDSPGAIARLLVNDVSAVEVGERLQLAARAAYEAPVEVRDALRDRYGVNLGDLTAVYLDDTKALPLLEQRYKAAEVAGAAALSNIGVSTATAERLAAQGVAYGAAVQGFGAVAGQRDLTRGLIGGGSVSQDTLIGAQFGQGDAANQVEAEARRRAAAYRSNQGGAATTQSGVSGLASSSR